MENDLGKTVAEREGGGMEGEKGLQGHAYLEYQSLSLGRTRSYWPTPDAA